MIQQALACELSVSGNEKRDLSYHVKRTLEVMQIELTQQ